VTDARPRTLLIDSEQLESGDALDETFRKAAAPEIEQFRRERVERSGETSPARRRKAQYLKIFEVLCTGVSIMLQRLEACYRPAELRLWTCFIKPYILVHIRP
jgi:hypothetical protein